jgi:hypothetical protein
MLLPWLYLQIPAVASHTGFSPVEFPVYGANEVAQLPRNIRLFAPANYGGYLIYRFRGELKVFVDGRDDFYGVAFLERYRQLMEVRPGWQQVLDAYGFTHALLPNDAVLLPALESAGWKALFRDDVSTLLAKSQLN